MNNIFLLIMLVFFSAAASAKPEKSSAKLSKKESYAECAIRVFQNSSSVQDVKQSCANEMDEFISERKTKHREKKERKQGLVRNSNRKARAGNGMGGVK